MFARKVSMHLKDAKTAPELTQRLENKVIPMLRDAEGFLDEITFIGPGRTEALAFSLWENKSNAENYNRDTYPQVVKLLEGLLERSPQVETYEVANSTFHKIAAATV